MNLSQVAATSIKMPIFKVKTMPQFGDRFKTSTSSSATKRGRSEREKEREGGEKRRRGREKGEGEEKIRSVGGKRGYIAH